MNKKPYDKAEFSCTYGHYHADEHAGYTLTDSKKLNSPWYYVYQNRKVLLYVDQNGPVKIQHMPPSGIFVCKRELGETQSKWQVWVQAKELNNGVPVSNFKSPNLRYDLEKPVYTVDWLPEKAIYKSQYANADIISEIFIPRDKATVCMKTTIVNKSGKDMEFTVCPTVFPYVNVPQMVAWDLPEWYLTTKAEKNGDCFCIYGQMREPSMDESKYRAVTFNADYDENAEFELNMNKFHRAGNFFFPQTVIEDLPFSNKVSNVENTPKHAETQAVWAIKYKTTIQAGGQKTFTQVLTVQEANLYDSKENQLERKYFDEKLYKESVATAKAFYESLFAKRKIKTSNPIYDNFINYFTPLQMYWVGSLDRGWPSSMRGTRDASQDFVGITPLDPDWARKTILQLLSHQRTDGWFPRQISTISRSAPHDMRNFSDGGAFFLELVYEYLTFTRNSSILWETTWWLNSDEQSTVLEHILQCVDYYIRPEHIGEHGLCKAWYGDWWDIMDEVGSKGRGESVTVTAQTVLNLKYMLESFSWLDTLGKLDERCKALQESYVKARESLIKAMRENALNKEGFFNGYFNDNGKWLLSDKDPDGASRIYLVSNAWAIISGVADEEMRKRVLENINQHSFGRMGYNTGSCEINEQIPNAGRVGNGSFSIACPYNHAQSFLVRASCVAGDWETAYKATRYILPIEQAYAPVEKTFAPPYAIANGYSNSDANLHRVELQFLSGTVSYVLRNVYSYFFGITYGFNGLTIQHCMPEVFGDCSAEFEYLGKKFSLAFKKVDKAEKSVMFNGKVWTKTAESAETRRTHPFFADADMLEENSIEIEY